VRRQIKGSGLTVNPVGLDGALLYRIALAWFLHKGPPIIPIPGRARLRACATAPRRFTSSWHMRTSRPSTRCPRFIGDDSSTFGEPW
jgi:hypothetical protein